MAGIGRPARGQEARISGYGAKGGVYPEKWIVPGKADTAVTVIEHPRGAVRKARADFR